MADATDPDAATDAAEGASVVYQCLNAPYTDWPRALPAAAARGAQPRPNATGALLVSLRTSMAMARPHGKPMTEDLPLAATTVKGRTRAAMTRELLAAADAGRVRLAIGRASDFFGAGVTTRQRSVSGSSATPWPASAPTSSATPTCATPIAMSPTSRRGLATLGTDERAAGGIWHLPGPETVTTRQLLELVAGEVGHPVGIRSVPKLAVRALGLFNPMMRELAEMSYEFDEPFVLDTTKYESVFRTDRHPAHHGDRSDSRLVSDAQRHVTVPGATEQ